jgi:hypothetical protein
MSATVPPNASASTAGIGTIDAIAAPKLEDQLTAPADQQQPPPRRRAASSTTNRRNGNRGAGYGATIRSIDINGQHFNLQKPGQKTP